MANPPQTAPWGDAAPAGTGMQAATGTRHPALQEALGFQVQETMPVSSRMNPANSPDLKAAAVAALMEMRPQTTVQGMLAAQFVALHFASMECLQGAGEKGSLPAVRDMNHHQAVWLGQLVEVQVGFGTAESVVGEGAVTPGLGRGDPGLSTGSDEEDGRIKWYCDESDCDEQGIRRG